MRRFLLLLVVLSGFSGAAQARFFVGADLSALINDGAVVPLGGVTIGTYNLFGDFGIRGTALSAPTVPFVEGSVDGTYSFGEGVVFYTGAGLGYSGFIDGGAVSLAGFTGLDFDASSVISLFVEIRPILYIGAGGTVQLRSGINFHIGDAPGGDSETAECCVLP